MKTPCKMLPVLLSLCSTVALVGTQEYEDNPAYVPHWQYTCVPDEGCQRVETRPDRTPAFVTHASLELCWSTCGRFGGLWPKPTTAVLSSQTVLFNPKFMKFNLNDVPTETRPLLVEMTTILSDNILAECGDRLALPHQTPVTVDVQVTDEAAGTTLGWHTDESYILDLQTKHVDNSDVEIFVDIRAKTIFGARHGLETLSQLVSANKTHKECSLNILTGAKVKDTPKYRHRGISLDTSRNFIPVSAIKRTINGMSASKMNVLHWHATDSHSFPLQSLRVPLLTRYGSYGEIYTVDEIKELIHYGLVRGVRVALEIDSPAHAGNGWQWGPDYGLGDLAVCVNAKEWRKFCIQPPCGQLNPANPNVYKVLRDLYADIIEIWPKGEVFHMGGDEVFIKCWNSSSEITDFMKASGLNLDEVGFITLWGNFHANILKIWDDENNNAGVTEQLPVILWSSRLTHAKNLTALLPRDRFVIQVWEPVNSPHLYDLLNQRYRVIASPKDVWYLDHGFWGSTTYSNWRSMYMYRLPPSDNLVLGGEVAMWSEYVDEHDLDARIWPRAAAVAERLWSDPEPNYVIAVEPRIQRHRFRLIARGIKADAISPKYCTQHSKRCKKMLYADAETTETPTSIISDKSIIYFHMDT